MIKYQRNNIKASDRTNRSFRLESLNKQGFKCQPQTNKGFIRIVFVSGSVPSDYYQMRIIHFMLFQ